MSIPSVTTQRFVHYTGQSITYPQSHFMLRDFDNTAHNRFYICDLIHTPTRTRLRVTLNPTDARCFRTIVMVIGNNASADERPTIGMFVSTCNRKATRGESIALMSALGMMACHVLVDLGFVGQVAIAGNNAHAEHSMNSNGVDVEMQVGTEGEMSTIHGHVMARGPRGSELAGVSLHAPPVGDEFAMKGPKVPWPSSSDEDGEEDSARRIALIFREHISKEVPHWAFEMVLPLQNTCTPPL